VQYTLSTNLHVRRVISQVCYLYMLAYVGQTLNSVSIISSSVYNLVQQENPEGEGGDKDEG
jgi:hypothetical protein